MKSQSALLLARTRLALARFGIVNLVTGALCAACVVAWTWGIPALRAQLQLQRQAVADVRKTLESAEEPAPPPPRTAAEERLAHFYDSLGDKRYAEQQLKTLFAIAGKNNLVLSQAEYKPSYDKNGRYHTYQISLPVKGSYVAIRQFCEQMLLTIPFASLDEMRFKRESVGSATLEAKLRFTLYLSDEMAQMAQQTFAPGMKGHGHE